MVIVAVALSGCGIKRLTQMGGDCRFFGCNEGYRCEDRGPSGFVCTDLAPCPDKPRCPKGEVPEQLPYEPSGCVWSGKCVAGVAEPE